MKYLILALCLGFTLASGCESEDEEPSSGKPTFNLNPDKDSETYLNERATKEFASKDIPQTWPGNPGEGFKDELFMGNWGYTEGSRCFEFLAGDRLQDHIVSFKDNLTCNFVEDQRDFTCVWSVDKTKRFIRIQRRHDDQSIRVLTVKYWVEGSEIVLEYNGHYESFQCKYRQLG